MGKLSRTATAVWSLLFLGGCSAIAGLDEVQERDCAPNCAITDPDAASPQDDTGTGDANSTMDAVGKGDASNGGRPDSSMMDTGTTADSSLMDTGTGLDTGAPPDAGRPDVAVDSSTGMDATNDTGSPGDAANDTSMAPDTSCGPTNTVQNCGACGQSCAATSTATASASCSGTACTYTCGTDTINNGQNTVPAYLDCNASIGYDPDGCECTATLTKSPISCCGTSCPTQHNIGLPNTSPYPPEVNFYDCNPAGTFNQTTAMEACTNFEGGPNFASDCTVQTCSSTGAHVVCGQNNVVCPCWQYDGTNIGKVAVGIVGDSNQDTCMCPGNADANTTSWN